MPIKFKPLFTITPRVANALMTIESIKEKIIHLPLTPVVLASLRETARLYTTHYSTMIEGNLLKPQQVEDVIKYEGHFPGRERDEREVKGYYTALNQIERWSAQGLTITENMIKTLHAQVMNDGRVIVKPTPYRDGQNVIRDGNTKNIVYLPPQASDVPRLMKSLVAWIKNTRELPCPIVAGLAHYQFATIHPYYDGNGRTARLLTTFILHRGGYDLKGLYSLEEYYARYLGKYYEAISIGPTYNYYDGRADSDVTQWLEYFIEGMRTSFEKVLSRMEDAGRTGVKDQSKWLRQLDPKQRKALELFEKFEIITSRQIGELFGFKERTCSQLCKKWVEEGFLEIVDYSKKGRKYKLNTSHLTVS